jgi:hypothetical protein
VKSGLLSADNARNTMFSRQARMIVRVEVIPRE